MGDTPRRGPTASIVLATIFLLSIPAFSVSGVAVAAAGNQPVDWPTFQHDHRNTGHDGNATGPRENVTVIWNVSAGGPVQSAPAVVDGTVYVGSDDNRVYALSASDGSERWNVSTGGSVKSSPAVVNDTVFVGSNDGRLYALNATDGTERWTVTTGGAVRSSPTVVADTVYVGSDDGNVYAIRTSNGTQRWSVTTGGAVKSSPAVAKSLVYVGSDDNSVYALNATDGSQRWNVATGSSIRSSPAVENRTVYAGSLDQSLYALNASDGTQRWRSSLGNDVRSSPAVMDGTVYVGTVPTGSKPRRTLHALNTADGTERWPFPIDVKSSPAVVDGVVYVGSVDNHVYAVNASDGTEIWNVPTGNDVVSSPAVVDGVVYVGSDDGNVYAIAEDHAPPAISNFAVQVEDTRTVSVSFDSNESLDAIAVEFENETGSVVETLTESDFGATGADPATYSARTTLASPGFYTVTLTTAADSVGNDGAAGESETVNLVVDDVSIQHLEGPAPDVSNLTASVYLAQGSNGRLQLQVRNNSAAENDLVNRTELSGIGVESNTTLAVNVTLVDWTPRVLFGTGRNLGWSTTDVGDDTTTLNLTVRPAETQLIASQLANPDDPWPSGPNDRADVRILSTVDLAVSDMGFLASRAERNLFNGTILATDAQSIGPPRYDAPNETVTIAVAGPHLTVGGSTNTGFYEVFVPEALLDEWGVSRPDDLTVTAIGEPVAPTTATNSSGGVRLVGPVHYSEGEIAVGPNPNSASDGDSAGGNSEDDGSSEGGGSSGTAGSSDSFDPPAETTRDGQTTTSTPPSTSSPRHTTGRKTPTPTSVSTPSATAVETVQVATEQSSPRSERVTTTVGEVSGGSVPDLGIVVVAVGLFGAGVLAIRRLG